MAPTAKQRKLIQELDRTCYKLGLDYWNSESRIEWSSTELEWMLRWIARGQVVYEYTVVDEVLSCRICWFLFGKRPFPKLWRTKKFRLFNYHVIEQLSLMPKLKFVKSLSGLPKAIYADIERLNDLRNALAHSLWPENLKRYRPMATWKGKSIFTADGLVAFDDDMAKIHEHFKDVFLTASNS